MKKLALITTMMTIFAAQGAAAQAQNSFHSNPPEASLRATELMGQTVHAPSVAAEGEDARWESVGKIGDMVVSRDGQIQAVLVDIGGFLGVGSREVAIRMSELDLVDNERTPGNPDDYLVVVELDRKTLEEAPVYEHGRGSAAEQVAVAPEVPAPRTSIPPGFEVAQLNQRTAGNLQRAEVYGVENKRIARIKDIMIDDDDRVSHVLIDVGGFLGLGAHTVALSIKEVDVFWNARDADVRVSVPLTRSQLAELPAYDG